jgi:hypothetical protein
MDSKNGGRHSCCVHGDYLLDWKAPLETLHRAEDFYRLLSGRSGETLDQGQEPGKRQRRRALWMLRGDKRPVEKVPFTVARLDLNFRIRSPRAAAIWKLYMIRLTHGMH